MKKVITLCLVLAAVLLAACASAEPFRTESGVKFGMTEQEAADLEAADGRPVKGSFEDAFARYIWFNRDVTFETLPCTDVQYAFDDDGRLYLVCYCCAGGEQDYSRIKKLLTERFGDPAADPEDPDQTGGISLLYSHRYEEYGRSSRVESAHWGLSDPRSALGVDLWYSPTGGVYTVFWDASNPASCNTVPKTYSDASGISFPYMQGWMVLHGSTEPRRIEFTAANDGFTTVDYSRMDFRDPGNPEEIPGMDYVDQSMVSYLLSEHDAQNLRTEFHHGTEYRVLEYRYTEEGAVALPFDTTVAMTIQDGIFHMFRYTTPPGRHDRRMPAFEAFLDSVTFEK